MEHCRLHAEMVRKAFDRKTVFSDISFEVNNGQSIAITGRNGSGKSTLAKILSGVLTPTAGKVFMEYSGRPIPAEERHCYTGFVAPYLQLFEEFSALENLQISASLRGHVYNSLRGDVLLDLVSLSTRKNDPVRTYSSGMKQRLKYAFALLDEPPILILDEPTANLDADGIHMVHSVMEAHRENAILVIATNDKEDLRFVDTVLSVEKEGGR